MASTERLTTTAMASDGRAIARSASGKVVFVEGALPGETVDVSLQSDRSSYSDARLVQVLAPAPERKAVPCPRSKEGCGGCQWQHVTPEGQRRLKAAMVEEALGRIGRLTDFEVSPTVALAPWHWRTTIRAGVVDGRASLRMAQSHALVAIEGCLITHPLLVPLLWGRRYRDASSVVLRCGARTGDRLVSASPKRVAVDVPADVSRRHFHEEAAGRRWRVSARSFFQSRADGADALAALVSRAAREVAAAGGETGSGGRPGSSAGRPGSSAGRPGSSGRLRAVDAYSGVGLFAGVLASEGWSVVAVEGARSSVEDARVNLAGLDVEVRQADVTRWRPVAADLVVADPSRAGLGRAGVSVLAGTGARRIVLISCDVASLGRDAGLLVAAGYGLTSVTPVDMFPQTRHVEVVSVFDRVPQGRVDR